MTKRNVIAGAFFLITALSTSTGFAQGNQITGNVTATSTYIWRGLAQTSNAAIQGGLQVDTNQGMYAGGWTSTANGSTASGGSSELDVYGGYKGKADLFGYDAGAIAYLYSPQPSGVDLNFFEIYVDVSRDFYGAKLSLSSDAGTYIEGYATLPLESWNLNLHIGHYSIDDTYDGFAGLDNYVDFKVGLGKDIGGAKVEFALTDTNLSGTAGDYRTTVSVTKNFNP